MGSKVGAVPQDPASVVSLTDALRIIKPKRSGEAYLVLTACCWHLKTGVPMPPELRQWLDQYLTNERKQIDATRSLHQANLSVILKKAERERLNGRKIKVTRVKAEFAAALGFSDSKIRKWKKEKYLATVTVNDYLNKLIGNLLP
jgi:cytochrome c biogenesis protein ResB